ncbi:FkbM family methyltransferase [Candidatus Kaiserbacteria bacterium]|nr:FkbM family methyltransferase [Candidatus Kaiserbacteria bacterium]
MKDLKDRTLSITSMFFRIFRKKHLSLRKRAALAFAYVTIITQRTLHRRIKNYDNSTVRLFSFSVHVADFEDYFWSFKDIFLEEGYNFKPDNDSPYIIDCGGNIGISVLYFKWRYLKSKILVFEPHPENLSLLRKNIEGNSITSVEIVPVALGDRNGSITLYGNKRAATVFEGFFGKKGRWNRELVENEAVVPIKILSEYMDDISVDLLKLDVEGSEGMILRDLSDKGKFGAIKRVIAEYHYRASDKNKLSSIIEILEDAGFLLAFFSGTQGVSDVSNRDFTHLMFTAVPKHLI